MNTVEDFENRWLLLDRLFLYKGVIFVHLDCTGTWLERGGIGLLLQICLEIFCLRYRQYLLDCE